MRYCISLMQPFATLIVIRAKKIETRSRYISHRGGLGIHASKKMASWQKGLVTAPVFAEALQKVGIYSWKDLPLGAIIGEADVTACKKMVPFDVDISEEDNEKSMHMLYHDEGKNPEFEFGDYQVGRFGIFMENATQFKKPIPAKGTIFPLIWPTDLF